MRGTNPSHCNNTQYIDCKKVERKHVFKCSILHNNTLTLLNDIPEFTSPTIMISKII